MYSLDLSIARCNQKVTPGGIEQRGIVTGRQHYIWARLPHLGQTGDNVKLPWKIGLTRIRLWLTAFV
jgi:hypothetical protein